MTFNELLKSQLMANDCNNYLISTTNGEMIECFYHCLYERGKKALEVYKQKDINILNTEIIDDNFGKTLYITIEL